MKEVGKKRRYRFCAGVVALIGVFVFTVQAFGQNFGYTYVAPPPGNEKNHAEILQLIYSGSFTRSGDPNDKNYYGSNGINALRAYDHDDESVSLNLLTQTLDGEVDQIWTDGQATVIAKAKYASFTQAFGWNGGGTETTYIPLLTQADIGGPGVPLSITGDFLWGYHPDGYQWWSLNENNSDGKDHFVTYKIEGLDGPATVWLIFMEDLPCGVTDRDYNDFVVEISAIPEPATIALLALGGLFLRRKR